MAGRQIRRGTNAERVALGGLSVGEFGFETDTKDVYIGAAGGDQLVSDASAWAHLGGQDQAVKTTSNPKFASAIAGSLVATPQNIKLTNELTNPVLTAPAGETSRIMDGTQCDLWYGGEADFKTLYYTYATDSSCKTFAAPTLCLSDIRFPYVIKEGTTYYLFAKRPSLGNDIYMWQSTNKTTWNIMNGGGAVFTASADPTSIYSYIWNPGVVVIGSTWHFFIECGTQADQSDAGLGYSYSTLAELNWDTHRTAIHIVPGGGNPNPIYVPNKSSIILFNGRLSLSPPVQWDIVAEYASVSDNLALAASWKTAPFFSIHYDDKHTADPDFVVAGATKDHNIIIGFFYDQAASHQLYADFTLDNFFDAITVYDEANFSNRNLIKISCLQEGDTPGIYAIGEDDNVGLNLWSRGTSPIGLMSSTTVTPRVDSASAFKVTNDTADALLTVSSVDNPVSVLDVCYPFGYIGTALTILSIRADLTGEGRHAMIRFGDKSQPTGDYQKGAIIYEGVNASSKGKIHIALENTDGAGSVTLADARMTFLANGNIGIGTTTPGTRLSIVGLPSYANDAAAGAGGLVAGDLYTETGTDPLRLVVKS